MDIERYFRRLCRCKLGKGHRLAIRRNWPDLCELEVTNSSFRPASEGPSLVKARL